MPKLVRGCLLLSLALASCPALARAQKLADPPRVLPQTTDKQELDRREALKLYARGLLYEEDNRLLEALKCFESAAKLDGGSVALNKSLIALYLALDRPTDALAACNATLKFVPAHTELWYLRGRLHRTQGQHKEAAAAWTRALDTPDIKTRPDLLVQVAGDLGSLYEDTNQLERAIDAFDVVAATLDNPAALVELGSYSKEEIDLRAASLQEHIGQLCLKRDQFERAAQAFTKAQQKDPRLSARLDLHLARVRLAQKKSAEALKHLDAYLRTQPQGIEAYELKIETLKSLQREVEIVPMLKAYAERDRHNLRLQLLLGRSLAGAKQWAEAEARFRAVLAESPTPEVYDGLFKLFLAEGKMVKAVDMLDQSVTKAKGDDKTPGDASAAVRARAMLGVLRDDPELVKALLKVAQAEIGRRPRSRATWQFLATLAGHAKQLDDAEKLFLHCMKLMASMRRRQRHQFEHEVYGGLLEVLFKKKKYAETVKWARKGLDECEAVHRLIFHDYLFRALAQQGKFDQALAELDEAIKAAGPEHQLYFRRTRCTVLSMAGRYDGAEAECRKLLEATTKADEIRDLRYSLSGILTSAKKYEKAEEQLRLILAADPNDDVANNDLGYIMADQNKNLEEAEKLVRKALELDRAQRGDQADKERIRVDVAGDQDRASYVDSLGWVLFRRGKFDEARKELERAVKLPNGDDPVLWDHLGDVYLRMKQVDKAKAAFEKAHELYEEDGRRQREDQFRELKRKLKLLK